jgi:hypothetical protein
MHLRKSFLVGLLVGAFALAAWQATATTLLTEDFSSGIPAAWVSPVPSAWTVVNGAAYQSQSVPNVRYELVYTPGTAWTDYSVQVDMWSTAWYHCCSSISLYFRYSNPSNYYRFHAEDDGSLYVDKQVAGVFTNISKVYVGFNSINQRNTYAISVTGSTIKVYMNSNLITTFSDSSLTSGTVALSGDNIPAYFDNVLVQATGTSVQHNGEVFITGGTLAGQALSASNWQVTVAPGAQISGTVQLSTNNTMGSSAVAPFGYTWTWGDRVTSIGSINSWIPTGQQTWSATFNQTAPSTPGTWYILFGFNGEYTLQQVFSCTNWTNPTVVWNDGNDYFDMNATNLSAAHTVGYVASWNYLFPDGVHLADVPVAPIKVVVSQPSSLHKAGDCNGDGVVSITELQQVVNNQLGLGFSACGDCDGSGVVTITELQMAVNCQLGLSSCVATCVH